MMVRQRIVTSIDRSACLRAQQVVVMALPMLMYVQAGLSEGVEYQWRLAKAFHCFKGIFDDEAEMAELCDAIEASSLIHIEVRPKGHKHIEAIVEFRRKGTASWRLFFDISPDGSTTNHKSEFVRQAGEMRKTPHRLRSSKSIERRLAKLSGRLQDEEETEAKRTSNPLPPNMGIHTVVKT